jgi:hypothetical protein
MRADRMLCCGLTDTLSRVRLALCIEAAITPRT